MARLELRQVTKTFATTTVIHGVERIKERLENEEQLRRDVMSVREQRCLFTLP